MKNTLLIAFLMIFGTFQTNAQDEEFGNYWKADMAEVNTYELMQGCYGELHKGQAMLVYATETFSKSKQIKLNNPDRNPSDAVQVMKANRIYNFTTGIYDYSIMQSVFTPVNHKKHPNTFKTTTSVQDWRGQTFTQVNLQTYKYKINLKSYFELEGDQEFQLDRTMLEDEIWNLIRIDPTALPKGDIQIIPSTLTARLRHTSISIEDAETTLKTNPQNNDQWIYTVDFIKSQRKLVIYFQKKFPHQIDSWEESYIDGGKELTTKAVLKKSTQIDFWNKNRNSDRPLRKDLGLE